MKHSIGAATVAVILSATTGTWAQDASRVLRVVPSADVAEMDPTRGPNTIARIFGQMVFDTLFALDHTMTPRPMMVASETVSPDHLTYSFTLRPGLRFHDGSPVTARDAVASLDRFMHGGSIGTTLRGKVAAVEVVNELSFTLKLNQPFGLVEYVLGGPGGAMVAILREADAKRAEGVALTNPIGSGPFRYVAAAREPGHRTVFERNPDYPARSEPADGLAGGRVVKVDRVEWTIMPAPTTAANALVTGEMDFWDGATPDLVPYLRQHNVVARRTEALQTMGFVRPNFQQPPFNDVRARQALALLFDQNDFMQAVAGSEVPWRTCYAYTACGSVLETEVGSEPYRKPDVVRAKQLLADAGYHGEPIVLVTTSQLPAINALALVAAQRLRDAGVNVDLQVQDWTTMFKRIITPNQTGPAAWNLFASTAGGGGWFHPFTNIGLDTSCGLKNFAGFPCDEEGDRLRQLVLAAPDDTSRKAAFEAFSRRMWAFLPYIPVGQYDSANAWRSNLSGVLDSYVVAYWNIEKH
jgi:peptide/nickel transport system substrate-binding protein